MLLRLRALWALALASAATLTPPRRLRYGIVGTGCIGQEHLRNLHLIPECQVVAIADNHEPSLAAGRETLRKQGASMGGERTTRVITATPRQLESLVRLSEAHARMRLSEWVEPSDVDEAVRLLKAATQTAATDPTTGTIDMDLITTGRSAAARTLLLSTSATCGACGVPMRACMWSTAGAMISSSSVTSSGASSNRSHLITQCEKSEVRRSDGTLWSSRAVANGQQRYRPRWVS